MGPEGTLPGPETSSAGPKKSSANCARQLAGAHAHVELEEPLQAPGLEVAGAGEHVLAVAHECLGVHHRRVLEDPDAGVEQPAVVEPLRRATRPVVRIGRDDEPDGDSPTRRCFDPADHAPVGDVRVDDVQRLAGAVHQLGDRVRDRAVPAGGVVQDDGGRTAGAFVERGEERLCAVCRDRAAEPAKAREEHELELRHDGALEADEQVVEAAVLEVIFDPGAADPADAPVDDDRLAMVDVTDRRRFQRIGRTPPRTARRGPAAWSRA